MQLSKWRAPFPVLSGILGYSLLSLLAVAGLTEFLSFLVVSFALSGPPPFYAGHCRGAGNGSCPQVLIEELNLSSASSAYDNFPWAEQFWREERARWNPAQFSYAPFRIWQSIPWNSAHVHFDQTELGIIRRTTDSNATCAATVWIFGGSTMQGQGSPDSTTIASYVARELNSAPDTCANVVNLGIDGYNTNQELILLLELLKAGHRPTVAVFYDGVNDTVVGAMAPADASRHLEFEAVRGRIEALPDLRSSFADFLRRRSYGVQLARTVLLRLGLRRPPAARSDAKELPARAAGTLDNYLQNIAIVQTIAREFKFDTVFFWQPMIYFGHKQLDAFENRVAEKYRKEFEPAASVYRETEARSPEKFIFLGRVFDEVREPIYIDAVHLGPRGNQIVAQYIAHTLVSTVRGHKPNR